MTFYKIKKFEICTDLNDYIKSIMVKVFIPFHVAFELLNGKMI